MHTQQDFINVVNKNQFQLASLLDHLFGSRGYVLRMNEYTIKTEKSELSPSQHFNLFADKLNSTVNKKALRHIWLWCCAANIYSALVSVDLDDEQKSTLLVAKDIATFGWNAWQISSSDWDIHLKSIEATISNVIHTLNHGARPTPLNSLLCAPVIPWLTELYPEIGPWRGELLDSKFPITDIVVEESYKTLISYEGRYYEWSHNETDLLKRLNKNDAPSFAFDYKNKRFRVQKHGLGARTQFSLRCLCSTPPALGI